MTIATSTALFCLLITTVALLTPGPEVEAFMQWLGQWLPWLSAGDSPSAQWGDKIVHLVLFMACGLSSGWAWTPSLRVAAALTAYGIVTELAQAGIPGRSASLADLAADAAGAALGIALASMIGARSVEGRGATG